jgi:hypothetical protein
VAAKNETADRADGDKHEVLTHTENEENCWCPDPLENLHDGLNRPKQKHEQRPKPTDEHKISSKNSRLDPVIEKIQSKTRAQGVNT